MKTLYENLGGTYREENGVFLPNLELPKQLTVHIGKYGQMRLDFLKKHRRGTYTTLLTEGRLAEHLSIIGEEARSMVDELTSELAKKRGIDEHLKATNFLLWTQEMNNCKASVEEITIEGKHLPLKRQFKQTPHNNSPQDSDSKSRGLFL